MKRKPSGTAKYLHEVFTENGGIKNYEEKIETRGMLKLSLFLAGCSLVCLGLDSLANRELKVDKIKKG
ncbi:MAG: hypothetical protein LUE29_09455 [Lachnospiraceae bacterium]|nr:hypothetical protein [Lachnospiraceae bacterium]